MKREGLTRLQSHLSIKAILHPSTLVNALLITSPAPDLQQESAIFYIHIVMLDQYPNM
jgi:hypothetical protein